MHPDAPYFIILLCLTPDDFTRQGKSAATQWVNQIICQCILFLMGCGALVAQSSGQAPFDSSLSSWVRISVWTRCTHVRRVSQRSGKSRGFSSQYSGFLPLEMLTGLVEDQDRYSANPSIVAVLRNIGS